MSEKTSQAQRILSLLESVHGDWVPLPRILGLFIANFRARISELRQAGYTIICEKEYVEGQTRTKYRLVRP